MSESHSIGGGRDRGRERVRLLMKGDLLPTPPSDLLSPSLRGRILMARYVANKEKQAKKARYNLWLKVKVVEGCACNILPSASLLPKYRK